MIIVTGSQGQVGRALMGALADEEATFLTREELDLSDHRTIKPTLNQFATPSLIINAAAYTAVDKAESEPEIAREVNATSVKELAEYCASHDIPLIHYSTDYVFNGAGDIPFSETVGTDPLSVYGRTKQDGETLIQQSGAKHLIFRTSWVYDADGQNFFNTMLKLAQSRSVLRIVNDQHGAPSYAPHLAAATMEAYAQAKVAAEFPSGTYHMCNAGETNWHAFALAIFELAKERGIELSIEEAIGIPTSEYPTPATRPHNSRLDCSHLERVFGIVMPDWKDGLKACMEAKYENS
ncbi:MAG: dTDP-4-dehydrorhamnose reductase [Rickettsiales bacterium]|nr:dTDP-4-dehydrorhamnose reductase [Rickettsiales bacterium]